MAPTGAAAPMTMIRSKMAHYEPRGYCNITAQTLAMFLFTNCIQLTETLLAAVTRYDCTQLYNSVLVHIILCSANGFYLAFYFRCQVTQLRDSHSSHLQSD